MVYSGTLRQRQVEFIACYFGYLALVAGVINAAARVLREQAMFLPQRPYFPNGTLREAVAYPQSSDQLVDADLSQALIRAGLAHLAGDLSAEANWTQKLSGGEQQRLAIARVFLKRPQWLFLDEATSALDEATEAIVYQALLDDMQSRGGTVISVAHRSSVANLHSHPWQMPSV